MLVKDLPENTNLRNTLVLIPKETFNTELRKITGLKRRKVYIYGSAIGDIWVKSNKRSKRIYPLIMFYHNILNWEVIK